MNSFVRQTGRHLWLALIAAGGICLLSSTLPGAAPSADGSNPARAKRIDWRLEKTTGEKPAPRGAGKWVAIGNKLVAIGGFRECFDRNKPGCEHVYYDDVFTFDVTTNKWEKKNPKSRTGAMPGGRAFLGASAYPKKKTVVFFGGARYSVNVATVKPYADAETIKVYDDLWEYDPEADTFAQRTYANQGPGARLGAEIAIKDDTLYLLGGYDHAFKAHNDLWSYDLLTNTWQRLKPDDGPQSPSKRYIFRFEFGESGREIYIFGGNYRERETIQRDDLWKYTIATNTFTEIISEKSTNITGRTHGAAAVIGDQFVIALGDIHGGGCQTDQASEHQNPTNEVWSLRAGGARPDSKWSRVQIGSSPPPLKRVFYAPAGDRLYVTLGFNYRCGGAGAEGAIYNTETYSLPLKQIHQALEP